MSALFTVRPISDRTAFRGEQHRKNSAFDVTYSQCLQLLERELWFLDARNVVLEADVTERQIRVDGQIRGDASPASPCVRLAFDSNQGPLIYATDRFVRPSWKHGKSVMQKDWQHNLYAIAKGLEALRMVDRYAITSNGEQYAGFKALPAGRAMPASHMTSDEAVAILANAAGGIPRAEVRADLVGVVRRAKIATHPDRRDGDHTAWNMVEEAARVLGVGR